MLERKKHEIIMRNILKDIYKDKYLAPRLGFKGGTAAYFFYDLPRFSVDLDFDLLINSATEDDFKSVNTVLSSICANYGIVEDSRVKFYTVFLLLSYERGYQKIKIEVSKRPALSEYEIKNMLGVSVLVIKKDHMFANKLVALTTRSGVASRDVFDINHFFTKLWDINEQALQVRTGKELKEYLRYIKEFILRHFNEANILTGLGELLDPKQKDWVRKHLVEDTIFKIDSFLASQ